MAHVIVRQQFQAGEKVTLTTPDGKTKTATVGKDSVLKFDGLDDGTFVTLRSDGGDVIRARAKETAHEGLPSAAPGHTVEEDRTVVGQRTTTNTSPESGVFTGEEPKKSNRVTDEANIPPGDASVEDAVSRAPEGTNAERQVENAGEGFVSSGEADVRQGDQVVEGDNDDTIRKAPEPRRVKSAKTKKARARTAAKKSAKASKKKASAAKKASPRKKSGAKKAAKKR